MTRDLGALGLEVPDVLVPRGDLDLSRWAVVAADQYTSQPEYWQRVDRAVGDHPSTLRLILPEVYLGESDVDERIARIQETSKRYVTEDVFRPPLRAFVYLDRRTSHVASRKGLLVALDLERYDFKKGSTTLVRATEKTVEERLPPRVHVRSGAVLELPHVMVLIDDPARRVIEPLADWAKTREPLYATDLMERGGSVTGWEVSDGEQIAAIADGLEALADVDGFQKRYGVSERQVLLYAMGDGNHSLAAAKVHWENVKKTLPDGARASHPARHALVELVNVHDDGLVFEPIHRVVFGVDPSALLDRTGPWFESRGSRTSVEPMTDASAQAARLQDLWKGGRHAVGFVTAKRRGVLVVDAPKHNLAVGSLQAFLDEDLAGRGGASIDYIHGDDVVEELSAAPERIGFTLPPMDKSDLFKTVIVDGALPRKTFSMGEADEKRFYLEARRIVPEE